MFSFHFRFRFLLSIFCFSLFVLCDAFEENGQNKSLAHHRPIGRRERQRLRSRPRDFLSECVAGYRERIEFHCQFPGMDKPCLRQNAKDSVNQLHVLATKCCTSRGLCTVDEIEAFCCRTMDCLALCYGQPFLDRIQNRFRYADILLKRHSSNDGEDESGGEMNKKEEEEDGEEDDQ